MNINSSNINPSEMVEQVAKENIEMRLLFKESIMQFIKVGEAQTSILRSLACETQDGIRGFGSQFDKLEAEYKKFICLANKLNREGI